MKFKKRNFYFDACCSWSYRWALPFDIMVESLDKDYTSIQITVLCFTLDFTTTSEQWEQKLNDMRGESGL